MVAQAATGVWCWSLPTATATRWSGEHRPLPSGGGGVLLQAFLHLSQAEPGSHFTMIRHGLPGHRSLVSSSGRKPTAW